MPVLQLNHVILKEAPGNLSKPSEAFAQENMPTIDNWASMGNVKLFEFNPNPITFIEENLFENAVCKMAAIMFRSQYADSGT